MLQVLLLSLFSLSVSEGTLDMLEAQNISTENWTSCELFLNNTSFDKISVIDIDWMIFYFWSPYIEQSYHIRFSVPSDVLLDRFRLELKDIIKPTVNWSDSELFVETSIDLSGLFIKTNTPGKFRMIPSMAVKYRESPYMFFAIKVVDGILGMMNCQDRVAYALAPIRTLNKMKPQDLHVTAAKIGFWNPFGKSYLAKSKSLDVEAPLPPLEDLDDAEDDIQVELDREQNRFQII